MDIFVCSLEERLGLEMEDGSVRWFVEGFYSYENSWKIFDEKRKGFGIDF